MEFMEIPVIVEGEIKHFNFSIINNEKEQICTISSENMEMQVDGELGLLSSNMPPAWEEAAINKLKHILNYFR